MSADWSSIPVPVPYANLNNPQTLNLYAMVADNPETFADLDGHTCGTIGASDRNGCTQEGNSKTATQGEGFKAHVLPPESAHEIIRHLVLPAS